MKLRKSKIEITDDAEHEAVNAVRRLAAETGYAEPVSPHPTHFANLIIKTNEAIDHVTSGKALSISWLARVAVPGVVAILFFFIGFHYYVPEKAGHQSTTEMLQSLPTSVVDSLLVASSSEVSLATTDLHSDLFDVSNDQLAEFYVSSESAATVLEALSEQQRQEVASLLESRSTNL